jgi:hypothetical protein
MAELNSNIQLPQTYDSLKGRLEAGNGAETKTITAPFPKPVSVALLCETNFEGQSTTNRAFRMLLYLRITPNTRLSAAGCFWTFIELICHQNPQDECLDRFKPCMISYHASNLTTVYTKWPCMIGETVYMSRHIENMSSRSRV